MIGDLRLEQFLSMRPQAGKCIRLILGHHLAVADHVGSKDSGKLAFHNDPDGRKEELNANVTPSWAATQQDQSAVVPRARRPYWVRAGLTAVPAVLSAYPS